MPFLLIVPESICSEYITANDIVNQYVFRRLNISPYAIEIVPLWQVDVYLNSIIKSNQNNALDYAKLVNSGTIPWNCTYFHLLDVLNFKGNLFRYGRTPESAFVRVIRNIGENYAEYSVAH